MPSTFAVKPLVAGGPGGSVTVTVSSATAHYHIVLTGLAPGSVHAIHDHIGLCREAIRTAHLAVLTVATADAAGRVVVDATAPSSDAGGGRIVIVYATAVGAEITGCADL